MEVVVVNDKSTDKTGEIIDNFVKDIPNFRAIHLETNSGGCSRPRNTGIENSDSEYLMFLDGDDWYTIDACEKMVAAIERFDSDIVAGQTVRTNNYEIWYEKQLYNKEKINFNVREVPFLLFDSLSVNKIYKRSFLNKHKLRFPEGIHYEDIVFTGQAYFLAESISIIPEPIYYWRVVENASVKSISNRRFEFANFENRIVAHRLLDKFMNENGFQLYRNIKNNRFLRHDLKLYTNDYSEFDDEYKNKFHDLIEEYLKESMDEYAFLSLPEKDRIMAYLLYHGDKSAFQDYIDYINRKSIKNNRVYINNGNYYFRSSKFKKNDLKFLRITEPEISYSISNIKLDNDFIEFNDNIEIIGRDTPAISYSWTLRNKKTKEVIVPLNENKDKVKFLLGNVSQGNYYLTLKIVDEGIVHKRKVKLNNVINFYNKKVSNKYLSKKLFLTSKNTFGIKVEYVKKIDKYKNFLKNNYLSQQLIKKVDNQKKLLKDKKISLIKKVANLLPIRSKWILFESHMGEQFSDNPKYIYQELVKRGSNYKYIWVFKNPNHIKLPGPGKKVKRGSGKHFYYMLRSKYWIDNQGMAQIVPKRKDQIYIQTWHGTPLKKMGFDQNTKMRDSEKRRLKFHTNSWDYFLSPNSYTSKIFRRAFRYYGPIIEVGYPRNDILIQNPIQKVNEIKSGLNIDVDTKVVLYAPTFRDWDLNGYQKAIKDIIKMGSQADEKTIVLLRLHYLLSKKVSNVNLPENIINVSDYNDVQELLLISDILVTDYSSIMFDYSLLKRPIILYCYDYDEYSARRGLYFNLKEKAPGPFCECIEDVIHFINDPKLLDDFNDVLYDFSNNFGELEKGNAAIRVVDQILEK
jgi:CDP-glycerol glycerophosphotransferase (TagB/SpsB family)/glycosyltransferase involved in cell wall biosynthesis